MGASVSVSMKAELEKPVDASDIRATNLNFAREEVIRLRLELGDLAKRNSKFDGQMHGLNIAKSKIYNNFHNFIF